MQQLNLTWTPTVPFWIAASLFILGATTAIEVPGLYMDAVNPDYIVVLLFNSLPLETTPTWIAGGLLFDRFPIIGNLYHGALSYYLGLPFYALFGTGVVGVRLTNMMFGLMVLAATAVLLSTFRVRPLIAGLCLALLAVDPAFLFIFRTQFYITTMPIACVFLSTALIQTTRMAPTPKIAFAAGLLAGMSCYGYFIYLFFLPTIIIFALFAWRGSERLPALLTSAAAGFSLFILPYFVGFGRMMWQDGGVLAFVVHMSDAVHSLGVQSSVLGLNDRIALFGEFIIDTIGNVGPSNMMLGEYIKPVLAGPKTLAIIGLPLLVGSLGLVVRSMRQEGLYIIGGFVFGFFVLVLVFGDRLWLHHASSVLPVLYVGLTLAIDRLASIIRHPAAAGAIVAVLVMPFIVANAASRQELFMRLEATGGVGLSSDAITRYAKDSVRESPNIYRLFPDWGVSMPFEMVTRGSLPVAAEFSRDFARSLLCSGRDVEVALITRSSDERIDQWTEQMRWTAPKLSNYAQRDGKSVLTVARWKAANCAGQ